MSACVRDNPIFTSRPARRLHALPGAVGQRPSLGRAPRAAQRRRRLPRRPQPGLQLRALTPLRVPAPRHAAAPHPRERPLGTVRRAAGGGRARTGVRAGSVAPTDSCLGGAFGET
jgi:hypothetical protein